MKLVIDITDAEYERIQAMDWKNGDRWYSDATIAIHNGTPLTKGHGRLIDADALIKKCAYALDHRFVIDFLDVIKAPTIIEADTTRDCKTCEHSSGGKCAGTEECHDCMWESKYIEADKEE